MTQYEVVREVSFDNTRVSTKRKTEIARNSIYHYNFILKRKIVLVLYGKKNYLLYFLFGFFEHRWHHKSCNVSENCRACLQRSAEEPSIGMIQAGHSIKEARFWNYFMLQSVSLFLWEFIVLISSNLSNDSWGEKICKLLCSCIVIIKVSMCYTRSSKVPEVLLTFDESPGFRQDCYILDSYWRNPELNAKAT